MNCVIKLPQKVKFIFEKLQSNGFEVYAVGGCVRDSIMGKEPKDWDFTTSATPDEICKVFDDYKYFDIGKKFGTISVINNDETFEITTFRGEGEYSDSRHPDSVKFCSRVEDDLSRRDFTMNSIAYSEQRGIVDPFDGVSDIKKGIIRTTGDPLKRFSEDALRIMRAIRFSSVLGFSIEKHTSEAIMSLKESLLNVHPNRMNKEFLNLLMGQNVCNVLSEYAQVLAVIIPEIKPMLGCVQNNPHHKYDVWTHTVNTFEHAPLDETIRLSLFFHDSGKPYVKTTDKKGINHFKTHPVKSAKIAETVLRRFCFPNPLVNDVTLLVKYHDERFREGNVSIKKVLKVIGKDLFEKLITIANCDMYSQSEYKREEKIKLLYDVKEEFQKILRENQCYSLAQLEVDGNDIAGMGYSGQDIGLVLYLLLDYVIENKVENNKNALLQALADGTVRL